MQRAASPMKRLLRAYCKAMVRLLKAIASPFLSARAKLAINAATRLNALNWQVDGCIFVQNVSLRLRCRVLTAYEQRN
jgi:hypothetical protein